MEIRAQADLDLTKQAGLGNQFVEAQCQFVDRGALVRGEAQTALDEAEPGNPVRRFREHLRRRQIQGRVVEQIELGLRVEGRKAKLSDLLASRRPGIVHRTV